jgi:type II secretory pathway pseudopilin PulG
MLTKLQTQGTKPRRQTLSPSRIRAVEPQFTTTLSSSSVNPVKKLSAKLKHTRSGFVLLEIVIALGLFSMVAVSLTQALDQIAQTSRLARDESRVMRVLESALAQAAHAPELKERTIAYDSTADGVKASATIKKIKLVTKNKAELDKMYVITVTAWIDDNGRSKLLERSMETYVYSPNSKD